MQETSNSETPFERPHLEQRNTCNDSRALRLGAACHTSPLIHGHPLRSATEDCGL
jgi:hypothetical protein